MSYYSNPITNLTIRQWAEDFSTAIAGCNDSRQKIETIKDLRERYGSFGASIGLKEAKDRIEQLLHVSYSTRLIMLYEEFRGLEEAQRPPDIRNPRVVTRSGAELRDFNGSLIAQCSVTGSDLVVSSGDGLTSITFSVADLDGIIEMLQSALPQYPIAIA